MNKYILMNKDKEILTFTFDEELGVVTEINDTKNIEYAPYSFKNSNNIRKSLDEWLSLRYGYSNVDIKGNSYIDNLKLKQNIIKASGLSLSDQYWFHSIEKNIKWQDINFFTNSFEYKKYIISTFSNNYSKVDMLFSPNSTTAGQLDKTWIINENKERCLLKSANTMFLTEPINEVIAYLVALIINLPATKYSINIIKNDKLDILVSSCKTFITPDTELIPASHIISHNERDTFKDTINKYISFLDENGIKDAKEKIEKQLLLDILLDNSDRHLNNFGVIRNVNTLKIIDVAPNYDCGRILGSTFCYTPERYNREHFSIHEFGYEVSEEEILDFLDENINITKEQYHKLYEIPNTYYLMLKDNLKYTSLKGDEIKHLCDVFKDNISYIEKELDKRGILK